MKDRLGKIFAIANNALYFADNHDYRAALYEICIEIKPEEADNIGEEYIEKDDAEDI